MPLHVTLFVGRVYSAFSSAHWGSEKSVLVGDVLGISVQNSSTLSNSRWQPNLFQHPMHFCSSMLSIRKINFASSPGKFFRSLFLYLAKQLRLLLDLALGLSAEDPIFLFDRVGFIFHLLLHPVSAEISPWGLLWPPCPLLLWSALSVYEVIIAHCRITFCVQLRSRCYPNLPPPPQKKTRKKKHGISGLWLQIVHTIWVSLCHCSFC